MHRTIISDSTPTNVPTVQSTLTRLEARRLLDGVQPESLSCMTEATIAMFEYLDDMTALNMTDYKLSDDYESLCDAEVLENTNHYQLLQLCEATSRRIAKLKSPTMNKQIRNMQGTVEGKLVMEAMTDEVEWLINEQKVVPQDKRLLGSDLYEIDGKWVVNPTSGILPIWQSDLIGDFEGTKKRLKEAVALGNGCAGCLRSI